MKALSATLVLVTLTTSACTSAALKEFNELGPDWPLGYYELVSFNGKDIPAPLPNGQILREGQCRLLDSPGGGLSFTLSFSYEGKPRVPGDGGPGVLKGELEIPEDDEGVARKPIQFVFKEIVEPIAYGSLSYDLEERTPGTLFGNELKMVGEDEILIFMRARDPRRRRFRP